MRKEDEKANSIETIHLKSKLLELKTEDNVEILIDVQALLKSPAGSDEAYFKITDIAKKFGKEAREITKLASIQDYIFVLKEEFKVKPKIVKRGKYQGGTWLHYKLLKPFLRWVLPTKDYAKLEVSGKLDFIFYKQEDLKSVYVVETEDNRIKIGISSNINKRFSEIQNAIGLKIINSISSVKVDNAYLIEQTLLTYFDDFRQNGEWLKDVKFKKVSQKMLELFHRYFLNDFEIKNNEIKILN
ncbi:KilA-N domain-containing protein,T5orf172 domain-containing protein [Thiovulum sp. ES]|nr:KilA-N domain-containing protein,T5orf172 domain-containing protein [Thiovulum sp. ES]